jgi:alpha-methylacyl-CoA racemase
MSTTESFGPLAGLRVIELGAVGPGPHAGMILADLGADVVRVDRPSGTQLGRPDATDPMLRGRRRVDANLKTPEGLEIVHALVAEADVVLEGYRPGVAERLGVGPDEMLELNPRLVYARATGWGQTGSLAHKAGHDMNYMSLTGALHALGAADDVPRPPLNLVGDYGGGSMLLMIGVLAGVWNVERTGQGQVVDAAMVDGVSLLSQKVWSWLNQDRWVDERESNFIDGGSPWYRCYRCADGEFMAVCAVEPQFYADLLVGLELDPASLPDQRDPAGYPLLHATFEKVFLSRTRDEWTEIFEPLDACTTPVLSWSEAAQNKALLERENIVVVDGVPQCGVAPRFSRTPGKVPPPLADPIPLEEVLSGWKQS